MIFCFRLQILTQFSLNKLCGVRRLFLLLAEGICVDHIGEYEWNQTTDLQIIYIIVHLCFLFIHAYFVAEYFYSCIHAYFVYIWIHRHHLDGGRGGVVLVFLLYFYVFLHVFVLVLHYLLQLDQESGHFVSRDREWGCSICIRICNICAFVLLLYMHCISICISFCISIWLSISISLFISIWLSIYISIGISIRISIWLSICIREAVKKSVF